MRKIQFLTMIFVTVLLLAACDKPKDIAFNVDNTDPVSLENRVIYQLNVGAFTPEGTFKAAEEQLARLDTLGADILWLMPIYPRGETKMSPYAALDNRAVNPSYGTVDDLRSFVSKAHLLGMKVWLDWVPNHVAVENPWTSEHPEYFTKDKKGRMINPHGWNDVYELNYQDTGLVNAMNAALKYWIDQADIDGFRCDYVSSPTIPVKYWQDIITELKGYNTGKVIEFLSETDISNPENIRIDSCGFDYDYAWDFQGQLAWRFKDNDQADSLRIICNRFLNANTQIRNRRMVYLTNHDQNYNDGGHTLEAFFGANRYALTVLEFTFTGMPLLYQGQEIGDPDTLNYFTDAKVKWEHVDPKMLNTVRSLIALHHTQPTLSSDAPVEFLTASHPSVFAYRRGPVVVVLNLGTDSVNAKVEGIEAGRYMQYLNSKSIAQGPSSSVLKFEQDPALALDAKGYAVYVKQ